jgi:ribosomal protein S18 acetylase RimI-like enzyme
MIASVSMRPIVQGERDEFLQMAVQYFRELNPAFCPCVDWQAIYFENIHKNPNYSLRWIVSGGQNIGFVLFGIEDHDFLPRKTGVIWELYVVLEERRKGVARKCAQLAIEEMSKLSPSKIRLEVVSGNEPAVALWKSLGFQKTAESFVIPMPSDSWK